MVLPVALQLDLSVQEGTMLQLLTVFDEALVHSSSVRLFIESQSQYFFFVSGVLCFYHMCECDYRWVLEW
jgi:hypothetical protein